MREIKFRGKSKLNGKWVYGSYIQGDAEDWCFICAHDSDISGEGIDIHSTRVITRTVGQYTGLKDANGVEIYEGDIIICQQYPFYGIAPNIEGYEGECKELNYVGEVWYSDEEATYYVSLNVVSNRVSGRATGSCLSEYEDCKVIGNIHQSNPELNA